ncbi:sensor histidine kinase [Veillonella montpellierensis]|uniref:sensor histidine kinase n=1 Tax=Veillonella montpellierensis TaxID=187328 RepID=UPI0023F8560B|nr:sensor histidine kinase [Veillonella montpellierensis]
MKLFDIIDEMTTLDTTQISLIIKFANLLRFAESVTHSTVVLFLLTSNNQFIAIQPQEDQNKPFSIQIIERYEMNLWWQLFHKRISIRGLQERSKGKMELMHAYPVIDNGGRIIAGISFVNPRIDSMNDMFLLQQEEIITETIYMAMMVPQHNQVDLYTPLSYQDGVIIFDEAGTILYGNEQAQQLIDVLGFNRRLIGTSIYGSSLKLSFVKKALQKHVGDTYDSIYDDIVIRQTVIPIFSRTRGNRSLLLLKDRTLVSQKEKELLVKNSVIKEIHHRVKNNLQTVAGLLRMEARRSQSPEVKSALQEGISRIESMALVHDIVSHYEADYVSIRSIYEELTRLLTNALVSDKDHITCIYEGDEVIIRSNQASYISLILNELISNSIKHGIQNECGTIILSVEEQGHLIMLSIKNTGKPFPPNFSVSTSKRLGLHIIQNLVENELHGTLTIDQATKEGANVMITIEKGD